jgi:hypothetical protein
MPKPKTSTTSIDKAITDATCPISWLSDELIITISRHLDITSLYAFSKTQKKHYAILNKQILPEKIKRQKEFSSLLFNYDCTQPTSQDKVTMQESILTLFYLDPNLVYNDFLLTMFLGCLQAYHNKAVISDTPGAPITREILNRIIHKTLPIKKAIALQVEKEQAQAMHEKNQAFLKQYSHRIRWQRDKKRCESDYNNMKITGWKSCIAGKNIQLSIGCPIRNKDTPSERLSLRVGTVLVMIECSERTMHPVDFIRSTSHLLRTYYPNAKIDPIMTSAETLEQDTTTDDIILEGVNECSHTISFMTTTHFAKDCVLFKRGVLPHVSNHPKHLKKQRPIDIERKITKLHKRGNSTAARKWHDMWADMREKFPEKRPLAPFNTLTKALAK